MLMLTIVLLLVCVNSETTRTSIEVDGEKINQDVYINRNQNTVTVSIGSVSHLPAENNYRSTINLHDYTRKLLAIKDIDAGECTVIEHVNETMSAVEKHLLNLKVFNHQLKLKEKKAFTKFPLRHTNLLKSFGSAIEEFCNGYNVFKGVPVAEKERRVSAKISGHRNPLKKCLLICLTCPYELREPSVEQVLAEKAIQSNMHVTPAVVG